ncbi:putative ATP-binding cassette transporter [Moraxella cuniculi DSM 21768]|uniref:ABC transporter ATP-binding protein YojI n=2 Tax=Moraxella cuniculi TaxID=34061 RepID=A0A448GY15_9GAMM|nr:multidrug ABC transporter permease/ATP-binding protein [Moraxella cuniculi]SIR88397.1 putative ATP-binding cassette transporter [Moraxella cuniculi DSM 21768]VEG13700.1 ABC transporter ATP-binding protein YojI [Moraxella cuniculi]
MIKTTSLTSIILTHNRKLLALSVLLNLLAAAVSMGVIAFINTRLLGNTALTWHSLPMFLLLIMVLLGMTFLSQYTLTYLGHQFVYQMRRDLVAQILGTCAEQLEQTGNSRILASLSNDIRSLNMAFVRLPELVYGVVFVLSASLYLASLSWQLFIIITVWIFLVVFVSLKLVDRVYHFLGKLRRTDDLLYQDYQTMLTASHQLKLNDKRANAVFEQFDLHAQQFRQTIIQADTHHLSAINWSNIMMFAGIGVVLVIANVYQITDIQTATTFALTILFLQAPLLSAVGAYPVYQAANVALTSIHRLKLSDLPFSTHAKQTIHHNWQKIRFDGVSYRYADGDFSIQNASFYLQRGEVVFLVGENGSGKSTLAKVLTGLYRPTTGQIRVDDQVITTDNLPAYQQLFTAIFGDFYLFDEIFCDDKTIIDEWLDLLQMQHKLQIDGSIITNTELSAGQKKRAALLLAVTDNKPVLLLDEWAADQDPHYRRVFYEKIITRLKQLGFTLFVISHDDRYFKYADRILKMDQGKLIEMDKAAVLTD